MTRTIWFVMSFYEHRDGVRREIPLAAAETREAAAAEVARRALSEATDESLPHQERARMFIKAFDVLVAS